MFDKVIIKPLRMGGDERGVQAAPSLDLLQMSDGPIQDLHIATIRPGFVRGNHYHPNHLEEFTVLASSAWSLHWDEGPDNHVNAERFSAGAVFLGIPKNFAHAIKNDGDSDLFFVAMVARPFDPADKENAIVRIVCPA